MTLSACLWLPGERDRCGVAGVALSTSADAAVDVGLADVVAREAAEIQRTFSFASGERIGWTSNGARMVFLRRGDLFFSKRSITQNGSESGRAVPTPDELIVLRLVTLAAVHRRHVATEHET